MPAPEEILYSIYRLQYDIFSFIRGLVTQERGACKVSVYSPISPSQPYLKPSSLILATGYEREHETLSV